MRYFLLDAGDSGITAHILAEIVRDHTESGDDRDVSFGSPLIGGRSELVTESELRETVMGTAALDAWIAHDDGVFDAETDELSAAADEPVRHLRLVKGSRA